MPIDLGKIPKRLAEAARQGNLVPFVGAGLSKHAKTADPKAFPDWNALLKELSQAGESGGYISADEKVQIENLVTRGKFLMAAQAIKSELPFDVFDAFMQQRFAPPDAEPGEIHLHLLRLKPPLIVTTNYDLLLEDAYAVEFKKAPQTVTHKDAPAVQRFLQAHRQWVDRPIIFKIHGSVGTAPSDAVLSELDYRELLYREPGYRTVLSAIFVMKVVLMLGFSFADPELSLLLESLRDSLKYRSSPDFVVLPKGEKGSIEKRRLHEDFGLEVIEYEPSAGHPELLELIDYLTSFVP